jgi:hypothetical protein
MSMAAISTRLYLLLFGILLLPSLAAAQSRAFGGTRDASNP